MRKPIALLIVVLLMSVSACAQNQTSENLPAKPDNMPVYQLFPTKNMWTFIKLNTRTGEMWQVQYTVDDDDYRFETYLNLRSLVPVEKEINGRFTLYATQNTYNFILLDQIDGHTWQVQWSLEAANRFVIPIE